LLAAISISTRSSAADYRLDPSFSVQLEKNDYWSVNMVSKSPDGGFYVGGYFSSIGGQHHRSLAKFNADGSGDRAFNPGGGFSGFIDPINSDGPTVTALAVQPNGHLIVAGDFSYYEGAFRGCIARLNPDGSLDPSFIPSGYGFSGKVTTLALQADGKILVGGLFTSFNLTTCPYIARLNSDGSIDSTFITNPGFDFNVLCVVVQPDGRILVGGSFDTFNGVMQGCIARLNSDGSRDATFNPGTGFDWRVRSLALQPNGQIVAAGWFSTFNGAPINCIARLNPNGSLDTTFNPGSGFNSEVYSVSLQPDGKIVAVGQFTSINGTPRNEIVRLNSNGSLDVTFNTGTGLQNRANAVAVTVQADGKIVAGGGFTQYNGIPAGGVVRLLADGSFEQTPPGSLRIPAKAQTALRLSNEKWFVAGDFSTVNGVARNGVARLNADGSVDLSFDPGSGLGSSNSIYSAIPQADGRYVVGGTIWSFNGTECDNVIRLLANGALDTSFSATNISRGNVYTLVQQPDGKILAGGEVPNSTTGGGSGGVIISSPSSPQPPHGAFLSRLNSDGTLDGSFVASTAIQSNEPFSWVEALSLQTDGNILVGGAFGFGGSSSIPNLLRLNTDGSVDSTFRAGIDLNQVVSAIAVQPDGRMVLGGRFVTYSNQITLTRINANGSSDLTFGTSANFDNIITSVALQPDGKIIAGGYFHSVNGATHHALARVDAHGTLDNEFTAPDVTADGANATAILPDGRLLVAGPTAYRDGVLQAGLVVLTPAAAPAPQPPVPDSQPSSGGGGGGALGGYFLTMISSVAALRFIQCRKHSR
jgi:uncharacterized delta-60 repeat protein